MFVDYAGMSVAVLDPETDTIREAQIFVAALGASSYSYAEATWTQSLPEWIGSHVRCFEFFGGVTESVVPDNLKTGVTKANYYEPDINPTYLDLARHYGTVILPTRINAPRDKAKVETAVQVVERWILARLRNHKFCGLYELNQAIGRLLVELNNKRFQKLPGSRRSMYESLERPALKPLPARRYQFAEWKKATVNIDYHIEVMRHYYSVPHQLIKKKIDVRITENSIECFYKSKPVAAHRRSRKKGGYTTLKEHMPKSHRQWAEWNPDRFIRWALKIGPDTAKLIETVIGSRPVAQQGYRSCLGILRLAKRYGDAAPGGGQQTGAGHRGQKLQEHRVDPQAQSGRPTGTASQRGCHRYRARQYPRGSILPLKGVIPC